MKLLLQVHAPFFRNYLYPEENKWEMNTTYIADRWRKTDNKSYLFRSRSHV